MGENAGRRDFGRMSKCADFLKLLAGQVGRGIYVWGANGDDLAAMKDPTAWIERKETSTVNANRAIALYKKRVAAGVNPILAFDCSGLCYWAMEKIGVQKTDVSSRGLYGLCKFNSDSGMTRDDLLAGDFVFHHNGTKIVHVGVYVGDGMVIECKGRDCGVVKTKLTSYAWNRYGRNAKITRDGTAKVCVVGKSVNVRAGGKVTSRKIGVAHRGEVFALRCTAESGWYGITFRNTDAFISNKIGLTEIIYN